MATVVHHQFTVHEYGKMIEMGIIEENDAVELIHGEIVKKMPIGRLHGATVKRLNQLLVTRLAGSAVVSVQDPVVLADSEPEPDLALLVHRADFYAAAKPTARDVLLVIEVSDTSLDYDREIKLPLYAQASIEELWIVNLEASQIESFRQPQNDGSYRSHSIYSRGDELRIAAFGDVTLSVAEILG